MSRAKLVGLLLAMALQMGVSGPANAGANEYTAFHDESSDSKVYASGVPLPGSWHAIDAYAHPDTGEVTGRIHFEAARIGMTQSATAETLSYLIVHDRMPVSADTITLSATIAVRSATARSNPDGLDAATYRSFYWLEALAGVATDTRDQGTFLEWSEPARILSSDGAETVTDERRTISVTFTRAQIHNPDEGRVQLFVAVQSLGGMSGGAGSFDLSFDIDVERLWVTYA